MTRNTAEFSLCDAFEVLRLLDDDPNATLDIRRHGYRLECVRDTASSSAGTEGAGDSTAPEPRRQTMLKAPAAGRFRGDVAVFMPGEQSVLIKAGMIVGRIRAGTKVTAITADVEGTVAHACVAPEGFVEYGQTLLVIDIA